MESKYEQYLLIKTQYSGILISNSNSIILYKYFINIADYLLTICRNKLKFFKVSICFS